MFKEIKELFQYINSKSPVNLRSFWISFVTVALVVILSKLGVRPPEFFNFTQNFKTEFVTPLPRKTDVMNVIIPKLSQKVNNYKLENDTNLIPEAKAVGEYNEAIAYGVIDYDTGEVLAEKNFDNQTNIASLTKIMTAIVALDLANPKEEFIVSAKAADMIPTKIGVEVGEKLTLDELINALMLTSANDAAEIIKEGINQKYGEEIFIKAMNEKAKNLKLNNSSFENPQGFDSEKNFSSIEDLAILSHYALENYPLIAEVAKKDYQYYPSNNNRGQMDLYNWNGLLGVYPGAFGLKIGNTGWAKYTTIVTSERNGKKIMAITLGAPGVLERDLWTAQLLDLGFEKSAGLSPINISEEQLKEKYSSWKYWN